MSDDSESCESNECSTNQTGRRAAVFVAVLLGYVLSPMPVAWGLQKAGVFDRLEAPFLVFYAPLVYLVDRIEFVEKFYGWYGSLFNL